MAGFKGLLELFARPPVSTQSALVTPSLNDPNWLCRELDERHIGAELQVVPALDLAEIVDDVVHRHLEIVAAEVIWAAVGVIQLAEDDPRQVAVAHHTPTLSRQAPAEVVDRGGIDDPSMAEHHALGKIDCGLLGHVPGEEWRSLVAVVRHGATPEHLLIAALGQVVIDACDVCFVVDFDRRGPTVTGEVVSVTH